MKKQKVFGIGFHKTATTSLSDALSLLGYKVTWTFGIHDEELSKNVLEKAIKIANNYNAFTDNPWPIIYKEMDKEYPGSKFILTIRDSEDWFGSIENHFGGKSTQMRKWIYGAADPIGSRNIYLSRYQDHNREVMEYFNARPDDLLVIDITKGEGWEKLCPFLEEDIPDEPFPKSNVRRN